MSDYWLSEAARLQSSTDHLMVEVERLRHYEAIVKFIANDYLELSYDKAQWQRDDWWKRCNKLIDSKLLDESK